MYIIQFAFQEGTLSSLLLKFCGCLKLCPYVNLIKRRQLPAAAAAAAAAAAKSLQSCSTLWDPIAGSTPGSWDSPGKNTGVACHFLLQCMKVKSESEVAQLYLTLHDSLGCNLEATKTT